MVPKIFPSTFKITQPKYKELTNPPSNNFHTEETILYLAISIYYVIIYLIISYIFIYCQYYFTTPLCATFQRLFFDFC